MRPFDSRHRYGLISKGQSKSGKSLLFHQWNYKSSSNEAAVVFPDGCCDVICSSPDTESATVFATEWDTRPRLTLLSAGASLTGYRLKPGVTIAADVVAEMCRDPAQIEKLIKETCQEDTEISGIIAALSLPSATVAQVARQSGTTPRTLQRRFQELSLPAPDFWRLLARARRAVAALPYRVPLADIACAYGYADQAHMSREFVRWFGLSPAHLRQNTVMIEEICQSGLGTWSDDCPLEL